MNFSIRHELQPTGRHPHRVRLSCDAAMTPRMARALQRELEKLKGLEGIKVNHLTGSVLFFADNQDKRDAALHFVENEFNCSQHDSLTAEEVEELLTGEKPTGAFIALARFFLLRPLLPMFWRMVVSTASALPFIIKGLRSLLKGKINVDVLDASALVVSMGMRDWRTVGMLTMLLAVAEALEVWTRERSLASLAESLALNVDNVWIIDRDGTEINVPLGKVQPGDMVVVNAGISIPVDGVVESGQALVNQAAMTGEPMPVVREKGGAVYAGTIVETGRLVIKVNQVGEGTRLHQVVSFIDQSEKEKSGLEAHYLRLADKAVPFTFGLAALVWLVTRNLMHTASVLLVDYSCALKIATPLAVLTAMRMGTQRGLAIKGGRYLEAIKEADTLVLAKTGTLTSAVPSVEAVIPAPGRNRREVLRIMACLEEHFPHPVSRAIVNKALEEHVGHEEEHTDVQYVVAHGIASTLHGHKMLLGSRHYLEHDEGVDLSIFDKESERQTALGRSVLFLSDDGVAAGMVVITDPIRKEADRVISQLRSLGFSRILMLTGDDERTARAVAASVNITEFMAHVLPAEKGRIVRKLNAEGCKVMMVGDGINDGAALSAASVGIAMGDGTDLARAVANVLLTRPNLEGLPFARTLACAAVSRIHANVAWSLGLNSLYLAGAIFLGFPPALTALLHNMTTIAISMNAIRTYPGALI